ncbi:hypothetical protein L1987_06531 [Smallanthus sonchifolius]|uniref:Uncharacterized protein n=1 Tax=Smallanthus sonchifolius TaxID=185202 RepID=A0ACB9JYL2_9ASTR|nr:hypothetical protein L1987_06531 [Smallanthus sonchifolius]
MFIIMPFDKFCEQYRKLKRDFDLENNITWFNGDGNLAFAGLGVNNFLVSLTDALCRLKGLIFWMRGSGIG